MAKVLAFICTRHRPMMLRTAVLQLMAQTYPVDISVYINTNEVQEEDYLTDHRKMIEDIAVPDGQKIFTKYGQSHYHHDNYIEALSEVDIDDYDLFLKIDDDDFYRIGYVENIVDSYAEHSWDMSGEHSVGTINGRYWKPNQTISNMGLAEKEGCCGMAATWAFSRAAIKEILTLEANPQWFEDRLWKDHVEFHSNLKMYCRGSSNPNYHYFLHGENVSTSSWLEKRKAKLLDVASKDVASKDVASKDVASKDVAEPLEEIQPSVLNSYEAVGLGLGLIGKALPHLPKDLYRGLRKRIKNLL